jgi:DNA-binding NarL/FixJ family response regulator
MVKIKPQITKDTLLKWQRMVDLIAELADVPATLIMNTNAPDHRVTVTSEGKENPYKVGRNFQLNEKLYCFGVMKNDGELIVEDATCDPKWCDNEDLEHGMSFYIGYPLKWPDGELFGTICVLDKRYNKRAMMFRKGLKEFCHVVEDDLAMLQEVERRKQAETKLHQTIESREATIKKRTEALEEANIALRVLLNNVELSKNEIEQRLYSQIKGLILPYLSKLRHLEVNKELQNTYLEIIEKNLEEITSQFSSKMTKIFETLTPTETDIIQMIMHGRTTKEIAQTLSRGTSTVDFHRNNIRKKLGLNDRKINLRQYLMSLA